MSYIREAYLNLVFLDSGMNLHPLSYFIPAILHELARVMVLNSLPEIYSIDSLPLNEDHSCCELVTITSDFKGTSRGLNCPLAGDIKSIIIAVWILIKYTISQMTPLMHQNL